MNADKSRMSPIHALQLTTGFLLVIIAGVGGALKPRAWSLQRTREACPGSIQGCLPSTRASSTMTYINWLGGSGFKNTRRKHKSLNIGL